MKGTVQLRGFSDLRDVTKFQFCSAKLKKKQTKITLSNKKKKAPFNQQMIKGQIRPCSYYSAFIGKRS